MKNGAIEMTTLKKIYEKDDEKEGVVLKQMNKANGMILPFGLMSRNVPSTPSRFHRQCIHFRFITFLDVRTG